MKKAKKEEKNLVLIHQSIDSTYDMIVKGGTTLGSVLDKLTSSGKIPDGGEVSVISGEKTYTDKDYVLQHGDVIDITASTEPDLSACDKLFDSNFHAYLKGDLDEAVDHGFTKRMNKLTSEVLDGLLEVEDSYGKDEEQPEGYDDNMVGLAEEDLDIDLVNEATDLLSEMLSKKGAAAGNISMRIENGNPVYLKLEYDK